MSDTKPCCESVTAKPYITKAERECAAYHRIKQLEADLEAVNGLIVWVENARIGIYPVYSMDHSFIGWHCGHMEKEYLTIREAVEAAKEQAEKEAENE